MKKYFMFAMAAAAMLSVTSCMNERDMDLAPSQELSAKEGVGYIRLNVSSDDEMATRATHSTNATGDEVSLDASNWTVSVSNTTTDPAINWSGLVSELTGHPFSAATGYTVTASNYANLKAALAATPASGDFGDAFYSGTSAAFEVTAGGTATPTIVCGKAKNAKLAVSLGTLTGITINSISVVGSDGDGGNRTIPFYSVSGQTVTNNTNKVAYFKADDELTYTVTYTTNSKPGTFSNKITLAEHTSNTLSITSTATGLITLTITYDDEFETGKTVTYTIDAATGDSGTPVVTP